MTVRCFDVKHFGYWKIQVVDLLHGKELEDAMLEKKPDSMDEKAWKKLDRHALGIIRNTVSINVSSHVVDETTIFGLALKFV